MPHLCDTHAEGAAARLRKGGKQYPFFKDDIWDESNEISKCSQTKKKANEGECSRIYFGSKVQ